MASNELLAVLSMDSYNRGYGEGIVGLGGLNSQIGSATLVDESDIAENSVGVNAGFYAAAYEVDGEIVISFRGTDGGFGDYWSDFALSAGSNIPPKWCTAC